MFKVCYRDFGENEIDEFEIEDEALEFAEHKWLMGYLIVQVYNEKNEIIVEFEN